MVVRGVLRGISRKRSQPNPEDTVSCSRSPSSCSRCNRPPRRRHRVATAVGRHVAVPGGSRSPPLQPDPRGLGRSGTALLAARAPATRSGYARYRDPRDRRLGDHPLHQQLTDTLRLCLLQLDRTIYKRQQRGGGALNPTTRRFAGRDSRGGYTIEYVGPSRDSRQAGGTDPAHEQDNGTMMRVRIGPAARAGEDGARAGVPLRVSRARSTAWRAQFPGRAWYEVRAVVPAGRGVRRRARLEQPSIPRRRASSTWNTAISTCRYRAQELRRGGDGTLPTP